MIDCYFGVSTKIREVHGKIVQPQLGKVIIAILITILCNYLIGHKKKGPVYRTKMRKYAIMGLIIFRIPAITPFLLDLRQS